MKPITFANLGDGDIIEPIAEEKAAEKETPQQVQQQISTQIRPGLPPPVVEGSRVSVDIAPGGEVKISFSGEVTADTFKMLEGIMKLQAEVHPILEDIKADSERLSAGDLTEEEQADTE